MCRLGWRCARALRMHFAFCTRVRVILGHLVLCVQSDLPSWCPHRWQMSVTTPSTEPTVTTQPHCCFCSRTCYRGRRCYMGKHLLEKAVVWLCKSCWTKLISEHNFNSSTSVLNSLEAEFGKQHQLILWLCFWLVGVLSLDLQFSSLAKYLCFLFCKLTPFTWKFSIVLKFQLCYGITCGY